MKGKEGRSNEKQGGERKERERKWMTLENNQRREKYGKQKTRRWILETRQKENNADGK